MGGLREFGISGGVGLQHVGGGCNVISPERVSQRGWRLWSPRRNRSHEGGNDSQKKSRRVVIEPSHIPSIWGCGRQRNPPRNSYRGGGADIRVGSGRTVADMCVSCYANDAESGG